jgi:hypothetical protein
MGELHGEEADLTGRPKPLLGQGRFHLRGWEEPTKSGKVVGHKEGGRPCWKCRGDPTTDALSVVKELGMFSSFLLVHILSLCTGDQTQGLTHARQVLFH